MGTKAAVAAGVVGAAIGTVVTGFAAGTMGGGAAIADLETARAEVRDLRQRIDALESRPAAPAPPAGVPAAVAEKVESQDRRIRALEAAVAEVRRAAAAPAPSDPLPSRPATPEQQAAAKAGEDLVRAGGEALEVAKKKLDEIQVKIAASIEEARKKALDRSLPETDRLVALERLRSLKGIDHEVSQAMAELFRASTSSANRERVLRDMHGTKDDAMKAVFLEALRGDPDETVRDRAARDIDDYMDDPAVIQALQAARDGDASESVRKRAARRLQEGAAEKK